MFPVANTLRGMKLKYSHKIIFNCPFWFCNLVAFQRRWEKSPLSSCNRWSYVVATKQVWPMTYGKIPAGCETESHWSSAAMYPWYSLLWPRPWHSVSCNICSWKPGTAGFLLKARLPLCSSSHFLKSMLKPIFDAWLATGSHTLPPDSWQLSSAHCPYSLCLFDEMKSCSVEHIFFPRRCIKRLNHLGHRTCAL